VLLPITAFGQAASPSSEAAAFQRFETERLLLLDHRGTAIGPTASDFPSEDFELFNEQRFHVVRAGDLRYRLSFEEFMQLAKNDTFEERWNAAQRKVKNHRDASIGMFVLGGALAAGGLALASVAFANGEDGITFALPPLLGAGAGFLVAGGAFATSAKRKARAIASQNLEVLSDRDEAWAASAAYNDALWRSLSLDGETPPESSETPPESGETGGESSETPPESGETGGEKPTP
jgi:hypothetical protein